MGLRETSDDVLSFSNPPRIIWCGYRTWAKQILTRVQLHGRCDVIASFDDPHKLSDFLSQHPTVDLVVFVGWSWRVPEASVKEYMCVGLHPSDLPKYGGGSPLQHQIIDGLKETKCTLFQLEPQLDTGPILAKKPMSLHGSIAEVFDELVRVGSELLIEAFSVWPDLKPIPQDLSAGFSRKRRTPSESRLERADFNRLSLQQLYDFIRALGDPYPNAFIEDDRGNRLLFKEVAFQSSNDIKRSQES
jgi:methionyl-tRNA formyltransferase